LIFPPYLSQQKGEENSPAPSFTSGRAGTKKKKERKAQFDFSRRKGKLVVLHFFSETREREKRRKALSSRSSHLGKRRGREGRRSLLRHASSVVYPEEREKKEVTSAIFT